MADVYAAVLEHWNGDPAVLPLALAALFLGIAALYCALTQRWICRGANGE